LKHPHNCANTARHVNPGSMEIQGEAIGQASPLPLIGQIVSSIVLFTATLSYSGGKVPVKYLDDIVKNWALAVAASVIAFVFSLTALVFMKAKAELYFKPLFTIPMMGAVCIGSFFSMFLFIWWGLCTCIITFDAPFKVTTNGYFAAWGGVISSVMGLGIGVGAQHSRPLVGLCVSSVVVILAVIDYIDKEVYLGETVFALIVSILSLILVLIFFLMEKVGHTVPAKVKLVLLIVLAITWVLAACLATFRGPFIVTSNGYFGVWVGCVCSAMAVSSGMSDITGTRVVSFGTGVVPGK